MLGLEKLSGRELEVIEKERKEMERDFYSRSAREVEGC